MVPGLAELPHCRRSGHHDATTAFNRGWPGGEVLAPVVGADDVASRSWEENRVMPCWASVSMRSLAAASHRLPRGTSVRSNHEISCAVLARVAAYSAGAVSTASAAASAIATVVSAAPLLIKAPGAP